MQAPPGSWLTVASVYVTAVEILDRPVPLAERVQLWASMPVGQALSLISSVLKDLDLATKPAREVEVGWVGHADSVKLRGQLLAALRDGRRVLVPQLLLLAAVEAIEYCPSGDPTDDFAGLDQVLEAHLGIAGELDAPRSGEDWGGLDSGLAAELVAQHHFGHTADAIDQLAWIHENWRTPWSQPTVKKELIAKAGGEPEDLFLEATKVEFDDFAAVGVHLWVQADQNGFLRYPSEFFDRLGIDRAAVDQFLAGTSTDLATLKSEVAAERARTGAARWAFNTLRRWPIVRLDNGQWLVLRLGFAIQRALGDATAWDVRNHLKAEDETNGSKRDEGFRGCLGYELEANVGQTLSRMFPGILRERRLYSEAILQNAWTRKGQRPSVCDFAVDCGDTWLLFDITDRRIPEKLVNAEATATDLDAELNLVLTEKKARQFASTVKLLMNEFGKLVKTRGHATPPSTFVCIVVTPTGGLGWNPAINTRVTELLADMRVLQSGRVLPLATMSVRELTELESAVEAGRAAASILTDWRTNRPGHSFERALIEMGIPLRRSDWVQDTAMHTIDELLERLQATGMD